MKYVIFCDTQRFAATAKVGANIFSYSILERDETYAHGTHLSKLGHEVVYINPAGYSLKYLKKLILRANPNGIIHPKSDSYRNAPDGLIRPWEVLAAWAKENNFCFGNNIYLSNRNLVITKHTMAAAA